MKKSSGLTDTAEFNSGANETQPCYKVKATRTQDVTKDNMIASQSHQGIKQQVMPPHQIPTHNHHHNQIIIRVHTTYNA